MLRQSQRLSGNQVTGVMKDGRVFHSPFFILRALDEKKQSQSRLVGVVPVKIGKTSVIRHLVRRRIYEAVRPFMKNIKSGQLIVLFAKAPTLKMKPAQMQQDIEALFVKAGLLR